MTRLSLLISLSFALPFIPSGLAGPACARKHYQVANCVSICKSKWGWTGSMMGTDPWGSVVKKVDINDWDSVVSVACGSPVASPTPSTAVQPIPSTSTALQTESVTPTIVVTTTSSTSSATSSKSSAISSSSVLSSSSIAPSVSAQGFLASARRSSTTVVPQPTTSIRPPQFQSTSTKVETVITTRQPATTKASTTQAPQVTQTPNNGGSTGSSGGTSNADIQAYLAGHNTIRAQHGAAPLTWSDSLAAKAQQWANGCKFQHSGGSLGPFGENLAAGTGSDYGISQAIKDWTDEVSDYNPSNPVASHFTQVVWKGTSEVGCAVQSCNGIFDASFGPAKYFVCEYSKQGNIVGQFALAPTHGTFMRLSSRVLRTASEATYVFLALVAVVATGLSCAAIISQAVRTSPGRSWTNNFNALVIGASYIIVFAASASFCVKRRVAVRLKLQRISKTYRSVGKHDLPDSVHKHVLQEYTRACLVSFESLPKNVYHEGWGRPGTKYNGVSFRRALLDTIPHIDELAHVVIPLHPRLKPHARMLHHFRFLNPLLPKDEDGMTPLHYYDSAIQLARHSSREVTEEEFETGMEAAYQIEKCLNECRLEMLESDSTTQLEG
ncbi:Protein PRY2 [Psilocybe cubensis]|uniref:SCP domain-containing protein n=2 Tax=Psilocybe cubensis TaxID=181762 RepID=A0A8H7YA83_PSICU|nr:Protein PRY2 [Psilocybe cubensis]KAH9486756.1 Protein PRY2 [Psilocybe cubensis]